MKMEKTAQNKMGVMPIPKLLMNLGLPMIFSMVIQGFYNVVDTYFVSQIADTAAVADMGDKAINALTLASPIQMLMIALMVGIGIPSNALMAKNLGKKDRESASRVAGNVLMLSSCVYVLFLLFGLIGARAFIATQTGDPLIADMGTAYLTIVTVFSFGSIGQMGIEKLEMGRGNTRATMIAQLVGALSNIVLDPIMIFGMFGLPAMGVRGAAIATVIGQCLGCLVLVYVHFFRNHEVDHGLRYLLPDKRILKSMAIIGLPATAMQLMSPIMAYGMNLILGSISGWAVTAYGVYHKLQYFVFMAAWGLNNANIPTTAYNYGTGSKRRVEQTLKYGMLYVMVIMAAGLIVLQVFPRQLVGLFDVAPETTQLCVTALRVAGWALLAGGANVVLQGICQALGNGVISMIVTALRYVIVPLPVAFLIARSVLAESLVWIAVPAGEYAGLVVAVVLACRLWKKRVSVL